MRSVSDLALPPRRGSDRALPAIAGIETAPGRETWQTLGFLRLAVAALLVSGIYVTLVAIARTPLIAFVMGRDYLYTALVAHVVFALDVWLLAVVALLWVVVAAGLDVPLPAGLGRASLCSSWLGAALLAVVPLAGLGRPVMADYVPVLLHPLFFAGLALFFGGIGLAAFGFCRVLWQVRGTRSKPLPLAALALGFAAMADLAALAVFSVSLVRWGTADIATLVWGSGHLYQLVNAAALIALWLTAAPITDGTLQRFVRASFLSWPVAIGAVVLVTISTVRWEAIATLFWASLGLPLVTTWLAVAGPLIATYWSRDRAPRADRFLLFSLVLLAIGGLIALPGMGSDTRVTAHYHATVGAVTMMAMMLIYRLIPRLGLVLPGQRLAQLQPYVYGGGLFALIAGLFWAGSAGTARKIFEAISTNPALLPATAVFGLGALATVAGGIIFVFGTGIALLGEPASLSRVASPQAEPAPLPEGGYR